MRDLALLMVFVAVCRLSVAELPAPELLTRLVDSAPSARCGNGPSTDPSFSEDGRFVFFASGASDLVAQDSNHARLGVFRHELATGAIERMSTLAAPEFPFLTEAFDPTFSGDGATVAFVSRAPAPGLVDTNGVEDVFVRTLPGDNLRCVSIRPDGQASGNGASGSAVLSRDGRWVIFASKASDLASVPDTNEDSDIFILDLTTGITRLISARSTEPGSGSGRSHSPITSPDASIVLFRSAATNLTDVGTGNRTDLFLWTRTNSLLRPIILPGPELPATSLPVRIINPVLDEKGARLAFRATSNSRTNNGLDGIWLLDLAADALTLIAETTDARESTGVDDASGPVMSKDGRTLAFAYRDSSASLASTSLRLWQSGIGLRTLAEFSAASSEAAPEPRVTLSPILSAEGDRIAFLARDTAGTPGETPTATNLGPARLLVRDLATGRTLTLPTPSLPEG